MLAETVFFDFLARRNIALPCSGNVSFSKCFIPESANGFSG